MTENTLGPTGEFVPEGTTNPTDQGAVNINISHGQGRVIVNFANPVAWFAMTPEQAFELGLLVMNNATAARQQQQQMTIPATPQQPAGGGNGRQDQN